MATGAAQAGAAVVTGVAGDLGNGVTGDLHTGAQVGVSAEGGAGFTYKDGKIQTEFGGVVGAGASADVAGSVGGAAGSVGGGAGVQVGSLGASVKPTIGLDGATVNVGLSLQLDIGIGINLNFNFSIDFAEIGNAIGDALKNAAVELYDKVTCGAACQAERAETNKRNSAMAAFGSTVATLNPFTDAAQMDAAMAKYQAACTSCEVSRVPTEVMRVVADAQMIDQSKQVFDDAVGKAQALATSGAGQGADWKNASTVLMELGYAQERQASAVKSINEIGAKYGAVLVASPGGVLGLAQLPSPEIAPGSATLNLGPITGSPQ